MSELMAQYEKLSLLDKEIDVQAELIEKLYDRVGYLEEEVLRLTPVRKSSTPKKGCQDKQGALLPVPSKPGG